jgi:hypothetical protein
MRYAFSICAMFTLSATALPSQAAPAVGSSSNEMRKAVALSQLRVGANVRVATRGRVAFNGRYRRLENESLVLYSADGDSPGIPLVEIDTLWVRGRNHARGFVNGAIIGGLLGAAGVALLATSITHSTGDACNCDAAVARTVAVSALLGGAVGSGVGWPSWLQAWPQ